MLNIISFSPNDVSFIDYKDISRLDWDLSSETFSSKALVDKLADRQIKNSDFLLLVPSITVLSKNDISRIKACIEKRSNSSLILLNKPELPYWTGAGLIAIRFDFFKRIDIKFTDYKQESRSKFMLETVSLCKDELISSLEISLHLDDMSNLGVEDYEIYDIDWYIKFNSQWIDILKKNKNISDDAQYAYMYMLQYRLIYNSNSKNKYVLNDSNIDIFYNHIKTALGFVNDNIIIDTPKKIIILNKEVRLFLLNLKYEDSAPHYQYDTNNITRFFKQQRIDSARKKPISITSMDYFNDTLIIAGECHFMFDSKKSHLIASCSDDEVVLDDTGIYSSYLLFGREIYRYHTFKLEISKVHLNKIKDVKFFLVNKDKKTRVNLKLLFTRQMSKLNNTTQSYWYIPQIDRIIKKDRTTIFITPGGMTRRLHSELRYIWELLFINDSITRQAILIRILSKIYRQLFGHQTVWLFSDKPYKAGDNGEYLYNYANKQDDGIKKYYILNKYCKDARLLREKGRKFIHYGSIIHKLIFLNSDIVFATHENQPSHNSISSDNIYLRDLFVYNTLFIQHGLTVQWLPKILNITVDNVKKYFIASQFENDNLTSREYGYTSKEIVKSGVPRYDGLINKQKKQILITPTWRKYIANPGEGTGKSRRRNESFRKTLYFKVYNRIINDNELILSAEKNGYEIVFLLHPVTSSQVSDFKPNNNKVKVIAPTDGLSYEKLLAESSIMVTDYSGVQFDFAYMKKPIIYYHPNELPPSYEEAIYTYDNNALGEIVGFHSELVQKLKEYMESNSQLSEIYTKRIDKFFYYHDYNNAKRIYDEALKFQRSINIK